MKSSKKPQKNHSITLLGWIDRSHRGPDLIVQPFLKDFNGTIFISKAEVSKFKCHVHTIVRVALHRNKGSNFDAKILEAFPNFNDPSLEIEVVAENHGFPLEFSDRAIKDAEEAATYRPGKRIDLTHTLHVTIDGETAKDFDDAICVERQKDGHLNLKVSIADVSHFVRESTTLDREAFQRGTSIYFPNTAIPMLPEQLSNHLCSLVPYEERFTLTCEMVLDASAKVLSSKIYPSVIKSAARLTYTTVSEIIEQKKIGLVEPEIERMLQLALELSLQVRKRRMAKGGLDLDLPEMNLEVSSTGDVLSIYKVIRNEAHRLIEDFMILANETVSERIEAAGYPSIFRVHEQPDPLKLERWQQVIEHWGFKLPERKDLISSLQAYLISVRGHPEEKILITSLLRSLKQAVYSANNVGHFGLGSSSYTHFTSPIRRYPDLMVHRILRKSDFLKAAEGPYPEEKLQEIAEECSLTERRAFVAERDLEDIKKSRFLEDKVGKTFEGVIVSIKSFGFFVEILPFCIDGLVPLRTLPRDEWFADELETSLRGVRTNQAFWLGDRVRIQLREVSRLKRQITFDYVEHISGQSVKAPRPEKKRTEERSRNEERPRHFDRKKKSGSKFKRRRR